MRGRISRPVGSVSSTLSWSALMGFPRTAVLVDLEEHQSWYVLPRVMK